MSDRPDYRALGYTPIRDSAAVRIGWAKRIGDVVHAIDDRWNITSTHPGKEAIGIAEMMIRRRTRCNTRRIAEIDTEMVCIAALALGLSKELDGFEGLALTHAAIARKREICERLAQIKSRLDALSIEMVSARRVAVA